VDVEPSGPPDQAIRLLPVAERDRLLTKLRDYPQSANTIPPPAGPNYLDREPPDLGDGVTEGERAVGREQQRRLVAARLADPVGRHAAGQQIAGREGLEAVAVGDPLAAGWVPLSGLLPALMAALQSDDAAAAMDHDGVRRETLVMLVAR
jgi:hypothetical protein